MRILRFICWLRGWHFSDCHLISVTPDTTNLSAKGCRVCGEVPKNGPLLNAINFVSWKV